MISRTSHSERLRFAVIDEMGLRVQLLGPILIAIRGTLGENAGSRRQAAARKENKSKAIRLDFVFCWS